MRSGKSFLVMLVLALGIGAYAYFVESKKDLTPPAAQHPKVFASADSGKVDTLEIHSATGEVTKLKKKGNDWQITAPVTADADASEVGSVVTTVTSLESQRTIDEKPTSVAAYGLAPAHFSISFRQTGDAATHTLDVGDKSPGGSDYYAQVDGQPKVFLVSSYLQDSLNKNTFDLRDKTVLKVSQDGVDNLAIDPASGKEVDLAKKGGDWQLTKPITAKADAGSVDSMVSRVSQAKMKAIVTPGSRPPAPAPKPADTTKPGEPAKPVTPEIKPATPATPPATGASTDYSAADLKAYGLDKPQLMVTVGAGSTRAQLEIGGKYDDQTVYAKDLSRPVVFTIEKGVLDDLSKKVDDLRVKDIFEFRAYTATSVDLTSGGTTYTFTKATPPAGSKDAPAVDVWKETKPTAKDVDQTKITDLLTTLSNLRADSFTDKAFATGEDLTVVAHYGDASAPKEEHITLRKSGAVVQAVQPGDTGAAVIPTAEFDKAVSGLKALVGIK